jgi:hypothetical protein
MLQVVDQFLKVGGFYNGMALEPSGIDNQQEQDVKTRFYGNGVFSWWAIKYSIFILLKVI